MSILKAGTYIVEAPTEPPEDTPVYADCGHEIIGGVHFDVIWGTAGGGYDFEGKTICPACARDKIDSMSLKELMWALGSKFITMEDIKNG